ncbi:MAG: hypothetical protein VKL39_09060, partial [Leptolyngbyaceae bacterium]|nr:hypothetical protein [Leptolyngbyaceae bacterium]
QFRGNELVLTGRGGLPADPSQVLRSPMVWQDWRLAESLANADNLNATPLNAPHDALSRITESDTQFVHHQEATHDRRAIAPIEAEGWTKTESGEIQLVAQGGLAHGRGYEDSVVDCREWR